MFCNVPTINRYGRHSFTRRFSNRRSTSWLPFWYSDIVGVVWLIHSRYILFLKKVCIIICSCFPASSVCLLQQDTIGNTAAEHYTPKNILDVRSFARLNRSGRVWGHARVTTRHSCPGLINVDIFTNNVLIINNLRHSTLLCSASSLCQNSLELRFDKSCFPLWLTTCLTDLCEQLFPCLFRLKFYVFKKLRGPPIGLREDIIGPFFVRENENRRFM